MPSGLSTFHFSDDCDEGGGDDMLEGGVSGDVEMDIEGLGVGAAGSTRGKGGLAWESRRPVSKEVWGCLCA